jgi:hypothetical protein
MEKILEHHGKFWAFCAIFLGIWEGIAIATKWIPTITDICRQYRSRKPIAVAITIWWVGLGWHLLKSQKRLIDGP